MDVAFPYRAVSPSLDGEVLVTLARSEKPQTGNGIARLVRRGSRAGVMLALERLVEQGVVDMDEVGSANTYVLNRGHIVAPVVDALLKLRTTLLERIAASIETWKRPPVHVSLFGSAARGDGDETSDIDLFVVRPSDVDEDDQQWRSQIHQLSQDIRKWTGNNANVSEVTQTNLPDLTNRKPRIIKELQRDAITITGKPMSQLLET